MPPPAAPHAFTGALPAARIEGARLYTGSCHCGAVRLALKSEPLDKTYRATRIVECVCSICQRVCLSSPPGCIRPLGLPS